MWECDWFWSYYDEENELEEYLTEGALMDDLYKAALVVLTLYVQMSRADREELCEHLSQLMIMIQNYIEGRLDETSPFVQLPFISFCKRQGLVQWQLWLLLFAGVERYYPESAELFAQISSDKKCSYMTGTLAYRICRDIYQDDAEVLCDMRLKTAYWETFFEKNNALLYGAERKMSPLRLRDEVYLYFIGNMEKLKNHPALISFYDGTGSLDDMAGREHELERLVRLWALSGRKNEACIAVTGNRNSGRKLLIRHAAARLKKKVLFIDFDILAHMENSGGELDRLCFYARLLGADPCFAEYRTREPHHNEEAGLGNRTDYREVRQWMTSCICRHGLRFLVTALHDFTALPDSGGVSDGVWVNVALAEPDAGQTLVLWDRFMKMHDCEGVNVSEMAGRYRLNAGTIKYVFDMADRIAKSNGRKRIVPEDIVMAVKNSNGQSLGEYAEALQTNIRWQELVVDEETTVQLKYVENRLKYKNIVGGLWGFDEKISYGKGTCALFYGPAGTGKTMAAKVLANELGLALYRVDLSRMVSKYIGETQKHISALFDYAKGVNALLFFDEADALFAKRTEVGDAHDRYANSDVAHLLQKLEEYEGISILATNLKDNIDDAFKRRIKYMIHFRMPDARTRELLWRKMLPVQAPVDSDLDTSFFAQNFEMSGSEIKDAMLHAAYMAAGEGGQIGNRHIMEAVRLCFLKYGKGLTKENFGYLAI